MALKLYIAYGTAAAQVIALRLQALAVVNGLSVYVPPAYTRHSDVATLDEQSANRLRESEVILGVITTVASEVCRQELNNAQAMGKKVIVIAEPASAPGLQPHFPDNLVMIDPGNPAAAEQGIVQFLKKMEMEQAARTALNRSRDLSARPFVICSSGVTGRRPCQNRWE